MIGDQYGCTIYATSGIINSNTLNATIGGDVMHAEKFSISLSPAFAHFVTHYKIAHQCKSRSEVIQEALRLLQQKELEGFYLEANAEIDSLYENTSADGLDNETW
ncbi:hypothetical protein BH10PSE19_BH10PSE19_23390 [soil metagenome]